MKEGYHTGISVLLLVVIAKCSAGQVNSIGDVMNKGKLDRSDFSFNLSLSVLPPAKITRDQGNYRLQSKLQSAYELGFNYIFNANKTLAFKTGVTAVLGRWNFYSKIPDEDLPGYSSATGAPLIWSKDVWGAVKLPLIFEQKFKTNRLGSMAVNAGLSLRYSGFNSDVGIGGALLDSNFQTIYVFDSDFSMNNKNKLWTTFLIGISKLVQLKNYNVLSLSLQADISGTNFLTGNYQITIPGQPVTSGTYSINGSSIGISVAYTFTGTNRRLVRKYVKQELNL
jgi:hypothetical protein